jgi:hypothetical protein
MPPAEQERNDLEANAESTPEKKPDESNAAPSSEQVFSIYSINEKRFLVFLAGLAALFSPISANIYYSALNALASHFNTSLSNINLTVTTYLVSTPI